MFLIKELWFKNIFVNFEKELSEMNLEDNWNEDKINDIFKDIHNIALNEDDKLLNEIKILKIMKK